MSEMEEMNPMQCVEFEEIVHDLDRPGTHGVALRERALAHAESCAHCARLLTETESLDQALHAIATTEGEQEAPAWLESALLREFRDAKAGAARPSLGRHVAALGIAAAVLLVAGVSLFHFQPGVKGPVAGPSSQPNVPVAATAGQNAQGAPKMRRTLSRFRMRMIPMVWKAAPWCVCGFRALRWRRSGCP